MRGGWRPQDRTRGLTRMIHVKPWRCSTMGPQVRTPGPAGCAGCFTWNQQAMLGSLPPRVETSVLTRMGRLRPSLRPTPAGVGHANRPGRPGAAAAFRCSANRLRMHGCFTWNRRQRPGGRRPSEPDAGPGCLMREPVRCPTALVLGDSDGPQATKIHLESRRSSTPGAGQIRVPGCARCFTWNRRQCSGGTAPSASNARTGCLMRELRPSPRRWRSSARTPIPSSSGGTAPVFPVELRRCSPVGARLGRRTGWMFHVEPGGVFGRTTPPDSDARTG